MCSLLLGPPRVVLRWLGLMAPMLPGSFVEQLLQHCVVPLLRE